MPDPGRACDTAEKDASCVDLEEVKSLLPLTFQMF